MISSKYFLVVQNNFTTAGVVGLYNSTENTAVYTVKGNNDKKQRTRTNARASNTARANAQTFPNSRMHMQEIPTLKWLINPFFSSKCDTIIYKHCAGASPGW